MPVPSTYCGIVYNFTDKAYNVVNQDRHGQRVGVPPRDPSGLPGKGEFADTQIFPWCSYSDEVARNGWLFRSGDARPGEGTREFYMYQEPSYDRIAFTRYATPPPWPGIDTDLRAMAVVNVRILPDPFGRGDEPTVDKVE